MTRLPVPPAWEKKPPVVARILFALLFGISAVACAFKSWTSLVNGQYLTATVALCALVFIVAALSWVGRATIANSVSLRGHFDSDGTLLKLSLVSEINYYTILVAGLVASGVFAIFAPRGELDFGLSPGKRIFFPIWAGAFALFCLYALVLALKKKAASSIRLSPNSFELYDGMTLTSGEWSQIADVEATRPPRKNTRQITLTSTDGAQKTFGGSTAFTPGGVAIYWMIRHYWKHPEDRAELTDGRALDRLRDQQFDTT